jgi:hypothetical protein
MTQTEQLSKNLNENQLYLELAKLWLAEQESDFRTSEPHGKLGLSTDVIADFSARYIISTIRIPTEKAILVARFKSGLAKCGSIEEETSERFDEIVKKEYFRIEAIVHARLISGICFLINFI